MKIKNSLLMNVRFLDALVAFVKLPLQVKVSFPLQKCLKIVQSEEVSVRNARDELIKKYGEVENNEKGEQIGWNISKSSKENQNKFIQEVFNLGELEFELPLETKLQVKIKDIENLEVSAEHLLSIADLVDFVEGD